MCLDDLLDLGRVGGNHLPVVNVREELPSLPDLSPMGDSQDALTCALHDRISWDVVETVTKLCLRLKRMVSKYG